MVHKGRLPLDLQQQQMVGWCSWLSRQSNTLKVSGSSPGLIISFFSFFLNPHHRGLFFFVSWLSPIFMSVVFLALIAVLGVAGLLVCLF